MIQHGSSPLARGLRDLSLGRPCVDGIIPARAGFTIHVNTVFNIVADHPRSRGVYTTSLTFATVIAGSSPLARGLLSIAHWGDDQERIIPARAGFTAWGREAARESPDHPRSRGVYSSCNAASSRMDWIIPARAGFTRCGDARCRSGRDHPRSRGVYRPTRRNKRRPLGSSPLARGLR